MQPSETTLTPDEEARAAGKGIHAIWYVFVAEDRAGNDITWGVPIEIHDDAERATFEASRRRGTPQADAVEPNGRYVVDGPVNLLAFLKNGFASAAETRAALSGSTVALAHPKRWYHPGYYAESLKCAPLTAAEARDASKIPVWTVWYEDRFHYGDARQNHPVAVFLTEAEAQAELARRGRAVEPGGDGYCVQGPHPLAREESRPSEYGADVVRELLRRAEAKSWWARVRSLLGA